MLYPTNKFGKRFPSKRYSAWKIEAARAFRKNHPMMECRIHAVYKYVFQDKRIRDISNYEKCIGDFLTQNGVIKDDSLIDHLELIRINEGLPGVYITLNEI